MIKATVLAILLAAAAGRSAWGASVCTAGLPASPDGTVCMAASAVGAGGGCLKDAAHADNCVTKAGTQLNYILSRFSQPMSGQGISLWPGVLAAVRLAATDVSFAHAFPTPYMPSQGHDKITFTALPQTVVIKIYTLSGHLVKTINKSDPSDRTAWTPVANEQGSPLASGVYQFIITQPNVSSKKGRLMIIK